MNGEYDTYRAL
jgi:hypothetical protein